MHGIAFSENPMRKFPSFVLPGLLFSALVLSCHLAFAQSAKSELVSHAADPVLELRIHGSNTIGAALAPALVEGWLQTNGWRDIQKRVPAFDELLITATQADGRAAARPGLGGCR